MEAVGMKAEINIRPNFSATHIIAASKMSAHCGEVEYENRDSRFGSFFDDISSYSISCVLSSVASLESYINEVFIDRENYFSQHDIGILNEIWDLIESKRIIEKYEFALKLKSKPDLEKSGSIYGNAKVLINFRNAIVHFKPEWLNTQEKHKKLGKELRGKFGLSPFFGESEPLFPRKCLSYDMTVWAVNTVFSFVAEFSARAEIQDRLSGFRDRFTEK